ncbi:uncharacterized protein LOC116266052 isoform X1 [Nymphaea colorata]|nr:uncharacterized protein LOC116266052 isoform X1 [Nymphaea colorata]
MAAFLSVSALTAMAKERKPHFSISSPCDVVDILRKDKQLIMNSLDWARTHALPKLVKNIEDVFWLRHLEDHSSRPLPQPNPPPWPQPMYPPGLSCVELLGADLKVLGDCADYLRDYLSLACTVWTLPLPDVYDPLLVAQYFGCRPHVILFRLMEVFALFATAMFKIRMAGLLRQGRSGGGWAYDPSTSLESQAESGSYYGQVLKDALLSLGPTFIKVGQSLSTRPDIIGPEISEALSELHDQIPSFPRCTAMKIIEEELCCSVHAAFSFLSEEPVAAASFGQVYQGCTVDGYDVAVKVQRPNLHHAVLRDIHILRLGLGILRRIAKRKSDIALYADELGRGLLGELDYNTEAKNATEFLEAHAQYSFISIPKVYRHLSKKRVLTMQWMVGKKPNELLSLSRYLSNHEHLEKQQLEAKTHLLDMVNKGVEASLIQLLETGLLHADPHAGNLRYTPSGQIGFLDFGLLCRIEKKHQFALLASILHIANGDWPGVVHDLSEMDVIRPGTDLKLVTMDLVCSLDEITFNEGIPDVKFSKVLGKIWSVALKHHFRMPPYYTLVLRSLASLEGLALAADQGFKTFKAAYPYVVRKLLTDNSAPMRRILHSVLLNQKKELQWEKLTLFLEAGGGGYMSQTSVLTAPHSDSPDGNVGNIHGNMLSVAYLVLRLLPSENGAALRRLLMTVDPVSLLQAFISSGASSFRQCAAQILGNIMYHWVSEALGKYACMEVPDVQENHKACGTPVSAHQLYKILWRDRRVKVILGRILQIIWRRPLLMLRFSWCSFSILSSSFSQTFYLLLRGLEVQINFFGTPKRLFALNI